MPRRVRFQVKEVFSGEVARSFELFTGLSGGDCGIEFRPGVEYLVSAYRNRSRWFAGSCDITREARVSQDIIRHLRKQKIARRKPAG